MFSTVLALTGALLIPVAAIVFAVWKGTGPAGHFYEGPQEYIEITFSRRSE